MTDWYPSRAQEVIADIEAELDRKPMTRDDLAESLLISESRIGIYLARMKEEKLIHIAAWRKGAPTGHHAKVFARGDHPDAPKPPTQPKSERDRVRRLQRKAEAAAAAAAAPIKRSAAPALPDPMLAWIPRRAA
jgi:hypothetical protein